MKAIERCQKRYYMWALIFALIFAGFAIALVIVLPEDAGIWKLALPAILGTGGIASQFLTIYRSMQESGPLKELKESLKKKMTKSSPVDVNILLRPRRVKEYNILFEEFTQCDFIAFCAPFEIEKGRVYTKALELHEKRYKNGVISKYLFFDKDSYNRAVKFFTDLYKRVGLVGKIELRCLPKAIGPNYTYFGGTRGENSVPRCIFYPSVTLKRGLPDAVIVVDGDGNLLNILNDHFNREWDKVESLAQTISWKPKP